MDASDIANLAAQVKRNCNISDAKFWGYYSLCGMLLRLRELYRIENGIRPYEKIQSDGVGAWITERENLWRELEDKEYEEIAIGNARFGPFSAESINDLLGSEGLLYGAGYGLHMKPVFFLADIQSSRTVNGFRIYIAGREYARDLSENPAMLQSKTIIVRADMIRLLLWQRFEELRCNAAKDALRCAFARYGISPDDAPSEVTYERMRAVAEAEAETFVFHELGEAAENVRLGREWKDLLAELSDGRTGLFARGVKDVLADTTEEGMLRHIIDHRKEGSLGFYVVFLGGIRKVLFPEITSAFRVFIETGDWECIERARIEGRERAERYAARLLELYREKRNGTTLADSIEEELLKSLLP